MSLSLATMFQSLGPHISFPQGAVVNEQIALRWLHFVSGIIWIGTLYFLNLIGIPMMKDLDAPARGKISPILMTRTMWWLRWSAVVAVIAGGRYYWMILSADARNAGNSSLAFHWMGEWLLVWFVAFELIYPLQKPRKGFLDSPWVRTIGIAAITIAASWAVLELNANAQSSNAHLAIGIGGGMGLLMLLNAWGIVWRAQKRLIAWTRASVEQGTPMPPEAADLARWAYLASRTAFWMSFPMLFFMGAAEHFPFLSGIAN